MDERVGLGSKAGATNPSNWGHFPAIPEDYYSTVIYL